jgi:hypothetical protein
MNKLYSFQFNDPIAPGGGGGGVVFDLNNQGRRFKLKSVCWDIRVIDTVTNFTLVGDLLTTQRMALYFTPLIGFSNPYLNIVPVAAGNIMTNGQGFAMYQPGNQWKFDSGAGLNVITFAYDHFNFGANNINYNLSVTVEIEDIEILGVT